MTEGHTEIVEIFAVDEVNHSDDLLWDPVADLNLKTTDDCKPNCTRDGDAPLHQAAIKGFAGIISVLVDITVTVIKAHKDENCHRNRHTNIASDLKYLNITFIR